MEAISWTQTTPLEPLYQCGGGGMMSAVEVRRSCISVFIVRPVQTVGVRMSDNL